MFYQMSVTEAQKQISDKLASDIAHKSITAHFESYFDRIKTGQLDE